MTDTSQGVQSVQRAIRILEYVSDGAPSPSAVALHLGVHRSTASRLLETLSQGGRVRRDEHGLYGVGYRLAGLAQLALDQFDLANVARESLLRLGKASGHTIHLAELTGKTTVYADKIDPVRSVRLYSQIGQTVPFHTAGVAKAILVFQPDEFIDDVLRDYNFTIHTRTTLSNAQS